MSRRIVQVVAGLCNQYTAISVNPIIPMRRAGKGGCWFGPFLCNDRPMETDSYWRTRCVGEAPMQTFLDATPMTKEKMIAA
jgi:hypothetical protein